MKTSSLDMRGAFRSGLRAGFAAAGADGAS